MKKGINIWSFPAGTDVREAIQTAKKAGFQGIELAMDTDGLTGLPGADAAAQAAKMARDEGIELPSLASSIGWDALLTSALPEKRRLATERIRRQLEMAAKLGAQRILVLPGAVGVDFLPGGEENLLWYDQAYDAALEAIGSLAMLAARYGVHMALENVWNKFLLSPLEMRDFVDQIGSPYVGVYLDVGNVLLTGYPEQWVRILGQRIRQIHFKDYRKTPGGINAFCDLLSGNVHWPRVMHELRNIGYDGYCVAEMIPGYTYCPEQIIYNASKSMTAIFGLQEDA